MPRRLNPRKLRAALSYSVPELARALDITEATVRNMIKRGLPVMREARPLLILGQHAKDFIDAENNARRFKLADNELMCLTCKGGRPAFGGMVDLVLHPSKPARITSLCEDCGGKTSRTVSRSRISDLDAIFHVTRNAAETP